MADNLTPVTHSIVNVTSRGILGGWCHHCSCGASVNEPEGGQDAVDAHLAGPPSPPQPTIRQRMQALITERDQARTELDALRVDLADGNASDGHHTHRELYDYRMLYNAHAALGWLAAGIPVVKSRKHSDGEACFGGGWFIVTATLPTGQVSNHYSDEHWGLFNIPEVDLPPEWDGHAPSDAAKRLRALLAGDL